MGEYQEMIAKLFATFENLLGDAAPASLVAEVIYTAATDGTTQLRYGAGPDADQLLPARKAMDDASFRAMIKQNFNL